MNKKRFYIYAIMYSCGKNGEFSNIPHIIHLLNKLDNEELD